MAARSEIAKVAKITTKLESTGNTFVTTLTQDIQNTLEGLRADIANKEQVLKTHASALEAIELAQSM